MIRIKKKAFAWALISFLIIVITGGFVGYQMYTKPHRNVEHANALTVSALKLATAYENNETVANGLYLDKVLEVDGEISEISKNQKGETVIALKGTDMGTVRCTVEGPAPADIGSGAKAVLKGICTGYLTDVIMVRCVLQNR